MYYQDGWPRMFKDCSEAPLHGLGWIRWSVNARGEIDFKASCGWCQRTLSRTTGEAKRNTTVKGLGQGRPLALLWAWLDWADQQSGAGCGAAGVDHGRHWPSRDDRRQARGKVRNLASAKRWLDSERKPRGGADDSEGEPYGLP